MRRRVGGRLRAVGGVGAGGGDGAVTAVATAPARVGAARRPLQGAGLKIYLNGRLVDRREAVVSVYDHGLLYGDGVFEGIRAYTRLVFRLPQHIERLYQSAHAILLTIPLTREAMAAAVVDTLRANGLRDAYVRLVVTRGEGDLGLDPRKCTRPNVFIIADRIVLYPARIYEAGLSIITVPTQRNIPEALNPQIKSLNYLNNILAKLEAITAGSDEALLLNNQGYVTECTGENVFAVRGGRLVTPPSYLGVLRGVTRAAVMELAARQGIAVAEEVLTRHDLFNADEVFLTGTAAELVPVVKIDGRRIAAGVPGKVTGRLMRAFRQLTKTDGVRY